MDTVSKITNPELHALTDPMATSMKSFQTAKENIFDYSFYDDIYSNEINIQLKSQAR